MLYDGLLTRIAQAKGSMLQKDMENKSSKVTEAMNIIIGLREFLDLEQGGEVAANLDALYEYVQRTLMQAHIQNDEAKFNECRDLLQPISEAWGQIG
jgi:flagellar protein FliS